MVEKPKYFYIPQTFAENKSLRNFTTSNIPSTHKTGYLSQPNSSLTTQTTTSYQKPLNPVGSTYTSGQYLKNYSSNITQMHQRMDGLGVGAVKKQQTTVFSNMRTGNDGFELRSSVPVNHTKKPDIEFLRNTTFTPKPKGLFFGQHEINDQHHTDVSENKTSIEQSSYPFKFQKQIKKDDVGKDWKTQIIKFGKQSKQIKPINNPLPYSPPSSQFTTTIKPKLTFQTEQKKPILKASKTIINGFCVGKSLGVGKFAQVYLAKHIESGFICVLKKLSKQKIKEYQMESQVTQEIKIHAFLTHPNIVQFYGVFTDEKHIYMILEYLESGTLFDYLGDKHYLEQKQAVAFLRQICMAVKYLHNKGIAHRDIKPQNIIISYGLAKLCDFGWSARVLGSRKTYCGTFDYAPPQILQRKQYDQTVDLWCIGVLAYELLTNRVPFQHKERKITMQKILNVDKDKIVYPENISTRAKDFIEALVRKNPQERLKAYKLLDHPFLKQYEQQS